MAWKRVASIALAASFAASVQAEQANPIGKVLQMMSDLQSKILKEGESAQKVYHDFAEWCEERSKALSFEIKTGEGEVADLKASIAKEQADVESLTARLEQLAGELATDEADLEAATHIRSTEAAAFSASEKELMETVDTLRRAISIIEREMKKGGASMLQMKNAAGLVQAMNALVHAEELSTADAKKITALVQESASDEDVGAPAGSVYESQSGNILDTLTNLMEEAENQLSAARGQEMQDTHAFELLKKSLKDEIKYGEKEIAESKAGIAGAGSAKAKATGDLSVTSKDLSADVRSLAELHQECMTKAEDFEAETKSRGEELAAIAKAKEIIKESVGGAESLSYGLAQVSLLQVAKAGSQITTKAALAQFEAVRIVRDLARDEHSSALAQLAARLGAAAHTGDDQFAKIKGLIRDMLEKLEKEAEADASKKAWCDRNLADMHTKEADKQAEIEKLTSKIDSMSARSATLKEEVAALQEALANLSGSQAEMNKIRAEEKEAFEANSAEMKKGLDGVQLALKVLRDYYSKEGKAHSEAEGAGNGIISMLEVVESDFTKGLSQMTADEESAQAEYDAQTKQNEVDKVTKEADVKYKVKESTDLDKSVSETSSDRSGVQEELAAAQEYLEKLHGQCDEKAETFEQRKARFEAEIAGLKEALQVLESETALVQRAASRRQLRGVARHGA